MNDDQKRTEVVAQADCIRVLIVDDQPEFAERTLEVVRTLLQKLGKSSEIATPSSYSKACEVLCRQPKWDLLVTDVNLRVVSGQVDKYGIDLAAQAIHLAIPSIAMSTDPTISSRDLARYYVGFGTRYFRYVDKTELRVMLGTVLEDFVKHGDLSHSEERSPSDRGSRSIIQTIHPLAGVLNRIPRISLRQYTVVGDYVRHDPKSKAELTGRYRAIERALENKTTAHEHFMICASPGSGKTYFVKQIADVKAGSISFETINLTHDAVAVLQDKTAEFAKIKRPILILLDEADAANPTITDEELLDFLDMNEKEKWTESVVFVLVGSKRGGVADMSKHIEERMVPGLDGDRPGKGADLMRRIPDNNRFPLPAASLEDLVIAMVGQARKAWISQSRVLKSVQKAAVFHAMTANGPTTIGKLSDLVKIAARRSVGENLLFDDLFEPNDMLKYEYISSQFETHRELWESYLDVEE